MLSTAIKDPPETSAHVEPKFAGIAAAMSFTELDTMITSGIDAYKEDYGAMLKNKERLRVFVAEMRERLSRQGKRTDLPDTPKGLTWQKWVESKKKAIGSLSTIKRLLAEPKEKKKTLWVDLIDRLELLVPTVEDGNEHVIVHKLETATRDMTQAAIRYFSYAPLLCGLMGTIFALRALLVVQGNTLQQIQPHLPIAPSRGHHQRPRLFSFPHLCCHRVHDCLDDDRP